MKKQITILALTLLLTKSPGAVAAAFQAAATIPPEVTTAVELSNSDINRIVCPGTMSDLIFSREKGLDGHFSGNSAYLKFQVKKLDEELIHATTPSELFVVCNNTVYSLIATPRKIPSVTLRLAPAPGDAIKQNIALHQSMPLERRTLQFIREAATGHYPSSYRIMQADIQIRLSSDLDTRLTRVVDIEGVGLRLKEFNVKSIADTALDLTETDFLTPETGDNILAIAIEDHRLAPAATTRVFIVEQKEAGR
ncbi:type-F conjugative transfer system secretin TraK [Desulfurivibrio sp. D14AmB]|uniref:TraK domain-containing protein n=1 Tax=Desulfurivibrio sp. D14AmB TaxID=3374370 RepID=UPI00376EAE31